jgi:peptidoglycan/LPS O-acetylase OafA/YrhL
MAVGNGPEGVGAMSLAARENIRSRSTATSVSVEAGRQPGAGPATAKKRIPELDGLRGIAALAVVIAHYVGEVPHGIAALMIGWYGVDFFFVLSGFLMGSIILNHHTEPGFLKSFYLRRAARIIPIYFVVVCATIWLAALVRSNTWADQPFDAPVYLLFVTNLAMSFWGGGGEWLKPTWTLAVEEQFYLLLPLLVMLTPKRFLIGTLLGLCGVAIVFRYAFHELNPIAALTLLPARMDLLLGGVLLACVMQRLDLSRHLQVFRIVPLIAMVGLLAVAVGSREHLFPILNPTLLSVAFTSFLLAVLLGAPEGQRFRSRLLGYFGQISYALYLVHQPVSGLLHGILLNGTPDIGSIPQIGVTILAFAVSVAVAAASWKWLEQPILKRVPSQIQSSAHRERAAQSA